MQLDLLTFFCWFKYKLQLNIRSSVKIQIYKFEKSAVVVPVAFTQRKTEKCCKVYDARVVTTSFVGQAVLVLVLLKLAISAI